MQFLNIKFNVWEYTAALWTEINMFVKMHEWYPFKATFIKATYSLNLSSLHYVFERDSHPLYTYNCDPEAYLSCFKFIQL